MAQTLEGRTINWKRAYGLTPEAAVRSVAVKRLRHTELCFGLWNDKDFALAKRYAHAMLKGSRFPMLHCVSGKKGRIEVCDGNHRLYAVRRLGAKRIHIILWKH